MTRVGVGTSNWSHVGIRQRRAMMRIPRGGPRRGFPGDAGKSAASRFRPLFEPAATHGAGRGAAGQNEIRQILTRNIDVDMPTGLHAAPWMAGIAQLVERQVVVLDVTGSSPVARPTLLRGRRGHAGFRTSAPCHVSSEGATHCLIALSPVDCADALCAMPPASGSRRVAQRAERISMRHADLGVRPGDPFANVNTHDGLARTRTKAHGSRSTPGQDQFGRG